MSACGKVSASHGHRPLAIRHIPANIFEPYLKIRFVFIMYCWNAFPVQLTDLSSLDSTTNRSRVPATAAAAYCTTSSIISVSIGGWQVPAAKEVCALRGGLTVLSSSHGQSSAARHGHPRAGTLWAALGCCYYSATEHQRITSRTAQHARVPAEYVRLRRCVFLR